MGPVASQLGACSHSVNTVPLIEMPSYFRVVFTTSSARWIIRMMDMTPHDSTPGCVHHLQCRIALRVRGTWARFHLPPLITRVESVEEDAPLILLNPDHDPNPYLVDRASSPNSNPNYKCDPNPYLIDRAPSCRCPAAYTCMESGL